MEIKRQNLEFIAEVSANHLGSLNRAKQIIYAAANAGASAIKFQTYTADTMTLDIDSPNFRVSNEHELWGGENLYNLYRKAFTPWEWHRELFDLCRELGVKPFSSPFDPSAVEFLESLNAPMYKIASLETGDLELIRMVAKTGKPLIISTGATEWNEIEDVVDTVQKTGNKDLTLLVCTSSYPSMPVDAHLKRLSTLRNNFGVKVGVSDHTLGIGVSIAAIALGATVIEKHFTIRRSDGGFDGAFSMEPSEFEMLVREGNSAFQSLGNSEWSMQNVERESRRLRRSLYIVTNVVSGEFVSRENVKAIRPSGGCPPKIIENLLGKKFKSDFIAGTPMSEKHVE